MRASVLALCVAWCAPAIAQTQDDDPTQTEECCDDVRRPPPALVGSPQEETPPVYLPYQPSYLPPRKPPTVFHTSLALGGGYRSLYGVPYGVVSGQVLLGFDKGHFLFEGGFYGEGGAAYPRMPIGQFKVGVLVGGIIGRWRLATGVGWGVIAVRRVTNGDEASGFAFKLHAVVTFDLVQWDRHAVWLGLDIGADFSAFGTHDDGALDGDITPSATLNIGVRL